MFRVQLGCVNIVQHNQVKGAQAFGALGQILNGQIDQDLRPLLPGEAHAVEQRQRAPFRSDQANKIADIGLGPDGGLFCDQGFFVAHQAYVQLARKIVWQHVDRHAFARASRQIYRRGKDQRSLRAAHLNANFSGQVSALIFQLHPNGEPFPIFKVAVVGGSNVHRQVTALCLYGLFRQRQEANTEQQ